jgi:CRISP-associated protein Cas1
MTADYTVETVRPVAPRRVKNGDHRYMTAGQIEGDNLPKELFRHHGLWLKCSSLSTLSSAWTKVQANRGASGGDGQSIPAFQKRLSHNLTALAGDLASSQYPHGDYRRVDIPKRKGGTRRLMIPTVRDRIAHTAIAEALKPILEPLFEDSSFAYRPGRSVKQAVAKIEHWRNSGYHHVIEADIVRYFDNIRHDLLSIKLAEAVARHAGSGPVLSFIADALDHQGIALGTEGCGLVQGSPLSPILANLYLDALDEAMDGRGVRIVRFADDFVVLCKSQKKAETALDEVTQVLAEHGLSLHQSGTRIVSFDKGFDFIGHLFVRSMAVKKTYDDDVSGTPATLFPEGPDEDEVEVTVPSGVRYDRGYGVVYLTDPSKSLTLRNESFSIRTPNDHEVAAISHLRVGRIEIGPGVKVSQSALEHCLATETEIAFVNGYGEQKGRLVRSERKASALQIKQAEAILNPVSRSLLARKLVEARIRNQRTQLFRLNRNAENADVRLALHSMGRILRKISPGATLDQIRGYEGAAAAEYWPCLGLLTEGATLPFRRQRPAKDPLNATINYLTAILERDIRAAIQGADLHVGFGILHAANDYSDAAIYDLMEPFRAPLTEGLAAYLFNARRLRMDMFGSADDVSIRIHTEGRRVIIKGYEQAAVKRINITGKKGKLAWRPMMLRQAFDLAKAFRTGDLHHFQPYLMEA